MTDAVWGGLIGIAGALVGSMGSHFLELRRHKQQHTVEKLDELQQQRQTAYGAFLGAASEPLVMALNEAAFSVESTRRVLDAHAVVDILGTRPVRTAARQLREANFALANSVKDELNLDAPTSEYRRARSNFLKAVREESSLPEDISETEKINVR